MAEAMAPIDTNVALPPAIAALAAKADAAYAQAYPQEPPAAAEAPVEAAPLQEPAPVTEPEAAPAPPAPELSAPEQRKGVDPASPEGKYYAMEGRYRASQRTLGEVQHLLQETSNELMHWQNIAQGKPTAQPSYLKQPAPNPDIRLINDQDVQTFGPELVDFVQRAAREVVAPDLAQINQRTQQVAQKVQSSAKQQMDEQLDREVPNWRQLNNDERFKNWARSQDVYSGQVRQKMLIAAYQSGNAPRVAAFFKGFLNEELATGNSPAAVQAEPVQPPRQAALALETITAPGRPKPAAGNTAVAAEKPVFTHAQIREFYRLVNQTPHYSGREADKKRDEEMIFAAQREGRVRG